MIKAYVHLAYGFSEETWAAKIRSNELIGLNDETPYGYGRGRAMGAAIEFSKDHPEGRLKRLFRLGFRWLLGFDFIHAWRNRSAVFRSDVVWTHTESQHLAIALLFWILRAPRGRRPRLLAQSVWLFDRWDGLNPLQRWFFKALMRQADVLTVLSPDNLQVARRAVPEVPAELVLFGVNTDGLRPIDPVKPWSNLKILAVGNDIHRDWSTLIEAVRRRPAWTLDIVSTRVSHSLVEGIQNARVRRMKSPAELRQLYDSANICVLPLKPNLHASGITVMEEAAIKGVPIVASDVGGLRAYFSGDEVRYVPTGEVEEMIRGIEELASDPASATAMAERAQKRMGPDGLSSTAYVRRHLEISERLLARAEGF